MISYLNNRKVGTLTEQKNNMADTKYPVWKRLLTNQGRAPDNTANCSIEQQSITEYLTVRLAFCKAAKKVLNTELCGVNGIYTDSLIDSLYCEDTTLSKLLRRFPVSGQSDTAPYVRELLTEYSDLLWANGYLKHYGWERHSVFRAVSDALESEGIRNHAIQIAEAFEQTETEVPEAEPTEEAFGSELSM